MVPMVPMVPMGQCRVGRDDIKLKRSRPTVLGPMGQGGRGRPTTVLGPMG